MQGVSSACLKQRRNRVAVISTSDKMQRKPLRLLERVQKIELEEQAKLQTLIMQR